MWPLHNAEAEDNSYMSVMLSQCKALYKMMLLPDPDPPFVAVLDLVSTSVCVLLASDAPMPSPFWWLWWMYMWYFLGIYRWHSHDLWVFHYLEVAFGPSNVQFLTLYHLLMQHWTQTCITCLSWTWKTRHYSLTPKGGRLNFWQHNSASVKKNLSYFHLFLSYPQNKRNKM